MSSGDPSLPRFRPRVSGGPAAWSRLLRLTVLALAGLVIPPAAWAADAAQPRLIFLLIGQSNMSGRGAVEEQDRIPHERIFAFTKDERWVPAVDPLHFDKPDRTGVGLASTFAREVAAQRPQASVGLVPAAVGGTSLDQWAPGGALFTAAVERARAAMKDGTLAGILWHQGEADRAPERAATYSARFVAMIAALRRELDADAVPLLVGGLGLFRPENEPVNAQLASLPARVAHCRFVPSEELTHVGDRTHFDAPALRTFGKRYAAAWLEMTKSPGIESRAPVTALAQDYTVIWHNPDPERYVEGSGLVRLNNGHLVAVVPVVPRTEWSRERRAMESRAHIVRSTDGGATWQPIAELPYYSAVPWKYRDALYLFANKGGTEHRNDDLVLLRSTDGGATWSEPVTLFQGHFWNCTTGMVFKNDKIYWAVDDLALDPALDPAVTVKAGANRGPRVVVGDLSGDPMNPQAWRLSNPVPFPGVPAELRAARFDANPSLYLEPNVIEVDGHIRVLAAFKPHQQTTAGMNAVFDLLDEDGRLELKFAQYHPMPGGQLKFGVIRDEPSQLYWATANLVVDGQNRFPWWKEGAAQGNQKGEPRGGNDRRLLMLLYSLDGLNWFQAGCVALAPSIGQSFMYGFPVVDGADLLIISRTSIRAPNSHDADYATFHRVRNFRQLALPLAPAGIAP